MFLFWRRKGTQGFATSHKIFLPETLKLLPISVDVYVVKNINLPNYYIMLNVVNISQWRLFFSASLIKSFRARALCDVIGVLAKIQKKLRQKQLSHWRIQGDPIVQFLSFHAVLGYNLAQYLVFARNPGVAPAPFGKSWTCH